MRSMRVLMLAGLMVIGSTALGENLVQNGDFSMPAASGAVPHWEKVSSACVIKEGSATFLRLKEGAAMAQQFIPVPPGKKGFKFSMKVRPADATAKRYEVNIYAADATRTRLGKDGNPAGPGGNLKYAAAYRIAPVDKKSWEEVELSGAIPSGASYLILTIYALDKGSVDFAEIELDGKATALR